MSRTDKFVSIGGLMLIVAAVWVASVSGRPAPDPNPDLPANGVEQWPKDVNFRDEQWGFGAKNGRCSPEGDRVKFDVTIVRAGIYADAESLWVGGEFIGPGGRTERTSQHFYLDRTRTRESVTLTYDPYRTQLPVEEVVTCRVYAIERGT